MRHRSFRAVSAALVLAAIGCSKSDASTSVSATSAPVNASGKHEVSVVANEKGFTPSSVEVKKGEGTTLVFKRTTDETCAKQVVFPEIKLTKDLPLNQPVAIDVPVSDARTLTFQCGMGMFKGKVVIN